MSDVREQFEQKFPLPLHVEWNGDEYVACESVYEDGTQHEYETAVYQAHDHNLRWETWQAARAGGEAVAEVLHPAVGVDLAWCDPWNKPPAGTKLYAAPPAPAVPETPAQIMQRFADDCLVNDHPGESFGMSIAGPLDESRVWPCLNAARAVFLEAKRILEWEESTGNSPNAPQPAGQEVDDG